MKRRLSWIVPALVVAILVIAVRRAVLYDHGMPWVHLYVRLDTRADSLLVGALLAILWIRRKTPTRFLGLAALTGLLGLLAQGWRLTPFPRPPANAQLIEHGIYGLVRHPLYTCNLCGFFGWALLWWSLPAMGLLRGQSAPRGAVAERALRRLLRLPASR